MWNIAKKFIVPFPSTYVVERASSTVTNLMTKKRNRLDIVPRGYLRLNLTAFTPEIENVALKHQIKPSH